MPRMAGGNLKIGGDAMRQSERQAGIVVLSIELELAIDRPSADRQQRLDHLTGELLDLLQQHRLPATWAVADPARSAASPSLLAGDVRHEIAVLGERSWIGRGAGRMRIERELSRRFGAARQAGMQVSTLVLRNVSQPVDLDLLLAYDIAAVSFPACHHAPTGPSAGTHRFGVWHAPLAWRLPLAPCWWQPAAWKVARRLREVAGNRGLLHVAIDGDALVECEDDGLAQARTIVGQVARMRDEGRILVRTLQDLAFENLALRSAQPAKSLLAPAA
ncbi:MAG TPA: hypothetical protein VFB96_11255 [Pirellulaceae bacterium]|nr:hypothetical protein [Pirellulaceae bacterium]